MEDIKEVKDNDKELLEESRTLATTLTGMCDSLEEIELVHSRGGEGYRAVMKLLQLYRKLKFDILVQKTIQTMDVMRQYDLMDDLSDSDMYMNMDFLMSLPENITYCSNELKRFVDSSEPARCGEFIHLVDSGMKLLRMQNEHLYDVIYLTYLDENEHDLEALMSKLNLTRSGYYRHRSEGITALSIILFGPMGERLPSARAKSDLFFHKYGEIFKMIGDLCDAAREQTQN